MNDDQNISEKNSKEQILNSEEQEANENISQEQTIEPSQPQTKNSKL